MMSPERWEQITEILERARELPTEARVAYLSESCGADAELRAEVESLLGAHAEAGDDFLGERALARHAAQVITAAPPDLSGQSIKHFELLKRLGIGGMGEVYLANDRSLRRQVALKLLPAQTSLDDERLRRFSFEARAASALNHPNIMTVYEFGEDRGRHYIVTEYVEGQTLRERLVHAPLPLAEALTLADQVLAALEAAHAAGIIHRDIKPENLMVRADGVVKVLDFGIAKLVPRAQEEAAGRAAVTSFNSTEAGIVLGTPGYMSPEQVRGLDVTALSDIFSLGVVLYEMLAGRLPFEGETKADFIAKVLTNEPPPLAQQRPDLPQAYDQVIGQLLNKDPAHRIASAQQARQALACLPRQLLSPQAMKWERLRQARPKLIWAGSLILLAGLVIAGFWRWRKESQGQAVLRIWSNLSNLYREEVYTNKFGRGMTAPVFSPDGQRIAFGMSEDANSHIYLLPRKGGTPQPVTFGNANHLQPLFAPDGQRLAFISDRSGTSEREIWTLSLSGGEPALLLKLSSRVDELVSWRAEADGERIYFAADQNLFVLSLRDLSVKTLTALPPLTPHRHSFSLSPEGKRLLYLEFKDQATQLLLLDLRRSDSPTVITSEAELRSPRWLADGQHAVFIGQISGHLLPQLFSFASGKTVPLDLGGTDFGELAAAPNGQMLLGQSKSENANIYSVNMRGEETAITTEKSIHYLPLPSPDGTSLLFHQFVGHFRPSGKLWEKALSGNVSVTPRADDVLGASWSPDGQWLAYAKPEIGGRELYLQSRQLKGEQKSDRLVSATLAPVWLQPLPYNLIFHEFTWASDSSRLVFVTMQARRPQLWQYHLPTQSLEALPLVGEAGEFFLSPLCAPQHERVALIRRNARVVPQSSSNYQLMVMETRQFFPLRQSSLKMHLVGWVETGEAVLLAEAKTVDNRRAQDATLYKCQVVTRRCQPVVSLSDVDMPSLRLSPDRETVAYIGERRRTQNIYLVSWRTGQQKQLTNNSEPGFFYAGLQWSADQSSLYFSKQLSFEILTLIGLRPQK